MTMKINRVFATLAGIAASLSLRTINRVTAARLAVRKQLGYIPVGAGRYCTVCPKGAGQGPASHTLAERHLVGSRTFTRRPRRFIRALSHHPFGRTLQQF